MVRLASLGQFSALPSTAEAVAGFLDARHGQPEQRGTRRVYASTLALLAAEFPKLEDLASDRLTAWFARRWGGSAPATWNNRLATIHAACAWWLEQGWLVNNPTEGIAHRKVAPDRTQALDRSAIAALLERKDVALRERVFWRMLYETAGRAEEVLQLDVEDLDLPNRRARVRRKGGAQDVICWRSGTARLLPRLLNGRRHGPLFLTERRSLLELASSDLDSASGKARLSYRQAAQLFTVATGGWHLHQLRHSALTHAAEEGASTPMLMSYSGHESVRSLAKYARVSAEALSRWQAQRDPSSRRRR